MSDLLMRPQSSFSERLQTFLSQTYEELSSLTGATRWVSSRPWNPHLSINSPQFATFVDSTAKEIEASEGRRQRSSAEDQAFRDAIRALVLDLFSAGRADPELQLGINLNANVYGGPQRTRYDNPSLTYRQLKAAFDGLIRLGYVQVIKRGWHDSAGKGANTKVVSTPRLLEKLINELELDESQVKRSPNAEVIILRGPKVGGRGPLLEYDDTDTTIAMRDRLRHINALIDTHSIELAISESDFKALQDRLRAKPGKSAIEFTRRSLCRIFNDGVFDHGGRFYDAWWQEIPSEYRSWITIDDEPIIEADYSSLHPRLLYARQHMDCQGDPYNVGLDPRHRKWIKKGFNSLLNAEDRRIATPAGYNAEEVGLAYRALVDRVALHHEPISTYFYTRVGLELQFVDSCIAEQVMLNLADQEILCLPVHDSFLVKVDHEHRLKEAMRSAYREMVGRELAGDDPDRLIKTVYSSIN